MKTPILIISFLLNILLFFSIRSCNQNKDSLEVSKLQLEKYAEERQKFEVKINEQGKTIAFQEQVIIRNTKEVQELLKANTDLNKVNQQIKISFENKIKNVIASYKDSIKFITIIDSFNNEVPIGVKFGTGFSKVEDWYSIYGTIEEVGVLFDSLSFNNRMTISIGSKRKNIFSPLKPMIEVYNENPYINITSLNNIKVEDKTKFYNKPGFNLATGFILGSATMYYLNAR